MSNEPIPSTPPPDVPYWVPSGAESRLLSKALQRAVAEVLQPIYKTLVLDAADPLERGVALSVVHLIWLEMCQQVNLARSAVEPTAPLAILDDLPDRIAKHLDLIGTKCATTDLLLKVRSAARLVRAIDTQLGNSAGRAALSGPSDHLTVTLPAETGNGGG